MNISRYNFLKSIKIDNSGIINENYWDSIYRFCLINKLDNLGDFINYYNEHRTEMDARYKFRYFDGIIDLINLIFFGDDLLEENLFNKKIINSDKKSLERLGFNKSEINKIIDSVLNNDEDVNIYIALKSCLDNFNFKNMSYEDEIFVNKLYSLVIYYKNNEKRIVENNIDLSLVKKEIEELKALYKRYNKTLSDICNKTSKIEKIIDSYPQDNLNIKRLVKEYEKIHCK